MGGENYVYVTYLTGEGRLLADVIDFLLPLFSHLARVFENLLVFEESSGDAIEEVLLLLLERQVVLVGVVRPTAL